MTYLADVGPSKQLGTEAGSSSQGWSLAALAIGACLILASALTHIVCWLWLDLAYPNLNPTDTKLALGIALADALVLLSLGVLANVAGGLGLRESRRVGAGRGLAVVGMWAAAAGLVCWLMAAANLIIVAISTLR